MAKYRKGIETTSETPFGRGCRGGLMPETPLPEVTPGKKEAELRREIPSMPVKRI